MKNIAAKGKRSETVTVAGKTATITPHHKTVAGHQYESFRIRFWQNGERRELTAPDLEIARRRAKEALKDHESGTAHVLKLTPKESANVSAAVDKLRVVGVPLLSAVTQFCEAHTRLGGDGTIADAVSFWLAERDKRALKPINVPDLVKAFADAKEADGMSAEYRKDIGRRLDKFAKHFKCPLASVTTSDIAEWLRGIGAKGRNFNNYRNALTTLFSYGRDFGYLPREKKTEAELLPRAKEAVNTIGIYTPGELRRILNAAPPNVLPSLAIGAFADLRSNEILRLEWTDVDLKGGRIVVAAKKAKTAQRRLVPILPCLAQWLAPYAEEEGAILPKVTTLTGFSRCLSQAIVAAGVPMVANGLRHSFASYRLAVVNSADQVALEMGNSPRKLFQNYRELVTPEDAAAWFAISPTAPENVVTMRAA